MSGWLVKQGGSLKPVIYLYPPQDAVIHVSLTFSDFYDISSLICIPDTRRSGKQIKWEEIRASPRGSLSIRNSAFPYLFYEIDRVPPYKITDASHHSPPQLVESVFCPEKPNRASFASNLWCVHAEDLLEFILVCCADHKLNMRESNEFIEFWLPRLLSLSGCSPVFYIRFLQEEYSKDVLLNINPTPDEVIRMYCCVSQALAQGLASTCNEYSWNESTQRKEQLLEDLFERVEQERQGKFVAVEWGGMFV
uniref:Uncharacterized protein n=2 Tax=Vannella robusta TaxID=1487602 RepID=A0A7S4HL22_9EUKA|mmetsp:Transcript_12294/g.15289  ORF Transcript_12294/g.15289 Transcript_12294/m.15289 type:complete len:251 (+) Transcript_12294:127-879(+)